MYAPEGNYNTLNLNNRIYNTGIYVRLSREDENASESESIANQKEYLTRFVIEQGWNLADIYTDDGFTGTNFNRPDFQRLVKDIEKKRINLVITKDLSRLGRDYIDTGYYLERYFPSKNVRYIALNDGIDTFANTSNNDMSPFKSVMNDMYAKDISKKVKTAMHTKRRNGEFIGSFAPYGYQKDPKDKGKLIIDQEVAGVVKRIFDMYLNGDGYTHIAHVLNSERITSPSGYKEQNTNYSNPRIKLKLWTHEMIRRILTNPTYAGHITQKRCEKINYKLKKLINVPREFWVTVKNTHEPIVDNGTFELVQEMIGKKSGIEYSDNKLEHTLGGLIYCGNCGERMTFTKTQKDIVYAICSKYKRHRLCTRHSFAEEELNTYVLGQLRKMTETLSIDKMVDFAKENYKEPDKKTVENELKAIETRLEDIKKAIKFLYEDKIKGILSEDDFINLVQDYNKEREQLTLRLTKIKLCNTNNGNEMSDINQFAGKIRELLSCKKVAKNDLITLIRKIDIFENHKIKIHYKFKNPYQKQV